MADVIDQLSDGLKRLILGGEGKEVIVSGAPGGGPEAGRENERVVLGGRIGSHIPRGGSTLGYGGHGDAIELAGEVSDDVKRLMAEHLARNAQRAVREPKPSARIRLVKAISLDAHIDDYEAVSGPFGLFDGTIAAPSAGNSVQTVSIQLPTSTPSPVLLLNRYPGALYMSIYVRSFAFVPTGTTGTGLQECWFSDITGATVGLGIYSAASQTVGQNSSVNSLLTGPITDPGNAVLGTLTVNNIGIAGTPTTVRFQLNLGYVAMVPDPWFNEQVVIPPTPNEVQAVYGSMGAQGG